MMDLLAKFYAAFAQREWAFMGSCYHAGATFRDPVFGDLDTDQVRAMWKMLLEGGTDLRIEFKVLEEHATGGRVRWDAYYTFSATGRKVHNAVISTFIFKEGAIFSQQDDFSFWRWSRQALGMTGSLLGWTPMLRLKVRRNATARLARSMDRRSAA